MNLNPSQSDNINLSESGILSQKDYSSIKDVSARSDITLKDRVGILLLRKGMSQNQLANEIGIAKGTMSKIINGEWIPTSSIKIRMSSILECDSLVLFSGKGYWEEYNKKINYSGEKK